MYRFLFALIFLFPIAGFAQELPDSLVARKVEVGSCTDGSKLYGSQYSIAPYNITKYEYNDTDKLLYVYLRLPKDSLRYRMGIHVACFDIIEKRMVWNRHFTLLNMDFRSLDESEYQLKLSRDVIVYQEEGRTIVIDAHTGNVLTRTSGNCNYVNIRKDIAVTNDGTAYSIRTGRELWRTSIENAQDWRAFHEVDSNSIVFVAEGLRYINLDNGTGWYKKLSTLKGNTKGMCSQVLEDSNCYYLAGRKELIKVQKSGEDVWRVPLPEERTGISELLSIGDTLFVLNLGYAIMFDKMADAASPYIAAYDKQSGVLLYRRKLNSSNPILSFKLSGDTVALRFPDGIGVYELRANTELAWQKTITEVYKGFFAFAPNESIVLKKTAGENMDIYRQYPGHYFLMDDDSKILHLNERLQKVSFVPRNQYVRNRLYDDGYRFINDGLKTSVTKDGKKKADLNFIPYKTDGRAIFYTRKEVFIVAELPE